VTSMTRPKRAWLVIAGQELRELWLSARGPVLVLLFSLLLSVITYLAAADKELNILDQRQTVNLVLQVTLAIGVALALLLSADAISGERERETLESLLLTPIPRRDIAIGKLVAAFSVWPVIILVAIPYIWILREGGEIFTDAVLVAPLIGALLVVAFASLGLVVSTASSSNRASLAVSFFAFVALMVPTQLPLKGWTGDALRYTNPVTAGSRFIEKVVVDNHSWGDEVSLLIAPVLAAVITLTAAVVLATRLRIYGGFGR